MSNLKLIHGSCADQTVDAVVNAGNLPNPAEESAKQCCRAYKKFIQDYPEYDIDVLLCAFTSAEYNAAKTIFNNIENK